MVNGKGHSTPRHNPDSLQESDLGFVADVPKGLASRLSTSVSESLSSGIKLGIADFADSPILPKAVAADDRVST